MFCGKCGAEVPDGYEFCMKCGTKIETTQGIEVEIQKNKRKKWLIPIIIVVVVAVLAVVALYYFKDVQKRNGLYNNTAWGTSYDDIKAIIEKRSGDPITTEGRVSEIIDDYGGDKDISAYIVYDCQDDDTLHNITLFITNGDDSKYTDKKLYDKYASELTDLYGESENDVIGEKWTNKKSQVSLVYMSEGMLIMEYEDIKTVED